MTDTSTCSKRRVTICFIYVGVVLFIIARGLMLLREHGERDMAKCDSWNQVLFDLPLIGDVSWYPLSHFALNAFLGFLFPTEARFIITAGIVWELAEWGAGCAIQNDWMGAHTFFASHCEKTHVPRSTQVERKVRTQYDGERGDAAWCQGSLWDIGWNVSGFYFGQCLRCVFQ